MPRPSWSPRRQLEGSTANESLPTDLFKSVQETSATASAPAPAESTPVTPGSYPQAKWTILNYCAADNNLYAYIYDDVASMEQFGSTNSVQLVTQLDHQNGGAYRFRVEKDADSEGAGKIDSPVLESLGKVNMSDPKTLTDFISWGMKKFPAERYMLVIADHGKGWQGLVEDESHQGWMSVPQLGQALEEAERQTGRKLDVIGFDACQMSALEVASEIQDRAGFMVASQALEGREGWPYQHILDQASLSDLHQAHLFKSDVESRQAAELVVRSAAQNADVLPTMAAIDLSQVGELEKRVKQVMDQLSGAGLKGADLRELRHQTQAFGFVHDLGDFLSQIESLPQAGASESLRKALQECREQLSRTVVAEHHSEQYPAASGLSIELKNAGRGYDQLRFAQNTNWKQALQSFS